MKDLTQDIWDQLFFDYVEGNLNPQDKKKVEACIASNPAAREELDAWKGTIVQEPLIGYSFPASRLSKPVLSLKLLGLSFILLTGIIACLLWINTSVRTSQVSSSIPVTINQKQEADHKNIATTSCQKVAGIREEKPISLPATSSVKTDKKITASTIQSVQDSGNSIKEVSSIEPTLPSLPEPVEIADPLAPVAKDSTSFKKKTYTKRELRKIEQAKRNATRERKAQEFLKGDKPYVVPISDGF